MMFGYPVTSAAMEQIEKIQQEFKCPVCFAEDERDVIALNCSAKHKFHIRCLKKVFLDKNPESVACLICHRHLSPDEERLVTNKKAYEFRFLQHMLIRLNNIMQQGLNNRKIPYWLQSITCERLTKIEMMLSMLRALPDLDPCALATIRLNLEKTYGKPNMIIPLSAPATNLEFKSLISGPIDSSITAQAPIALFDAECALCTNETDEDFSDLHCGHSFHTLCLQDMLAGRDAINLFLQAPVCPKCQIALTNEEAISLSLGESEVIMMRNKLKRLDFLQWKLSKREWFIHALGELYKQEYAIWFSSEDPLTSLVTKIRFCNDLQIDGSGPHDKPLNDKERKDLMTLQFSYSVYVLGRVLQSIVEKGKAPSTVAVLLVAFAFYLFY